MKLYRITPEKFLENYSGLGGSYKDGARWNHSGHPVMYFAPTPAVAMLEMANYLPNPRLVPKTYRLGVYTIPDQYVESLPDTPRLPEGWNSYPHLQHTRDIGTQWLSSSKKTALLVPSAAVPMGLDNIAVVNPLSKHITELKLVDVTKNIYNPRAFAGI